MTNTELDHLIIMINQIADNIAVNDSSAKVTAKVADHVTRFWARSMKDLIIDYANNDGERLRPIAREAIAVLQ